MHFITNCHATLVFYNDIHNVWAYAIKPCKVKNKDNVVPACTGNRALKYSANGARINSQTGSVVGTAVFIVTKKFQIHRHYF